MKKFLNPTALFLIFAALLFLVEYPREAHAQTATPSATKIPAKVDDLMDRLATRVAQLSQTEKKAIYGTVKSVTVSTFILETSTKNYKIELPDDLSVFQIIKGKRTQLTQEDIAEKDVATVFGKYDSTLDSLRAQVVFIEPSQSISHVIARVEDVNKTDYSFTVTTKENKRYTIDFETSSKLVMFENNSLIKGGFSKITKNSTVIVAGFVSGQKNDRISASRIILMSDQPASKPTSPAASPSATVKN